MFKLGMCSVTFRKLSVEKVIQLATESKLLGIEWGGDIHVPPNDLRNAKYVSDLSDKAGLEVASYGSYYRVGDYEANEHRFFDVLKTAKTLKAPSIRVWAGGKGSAEASSLYRDKVVEETYEIASLAAKENIRIHLEFHGNTLTDTSESAKLLMEEVNHPNVSIYWQPAVNVPVNERVSSIKEISPWLSHVHVFYWEGTTRLPFRNGVNDWEKYLSALHEPNTERYLYLEFVKDNCPTQFIEDARVLRKLVEEFN